jgi:hypothetical protein
MLYLMFVRRAGWIALPVLRQKVAVLRRQRFRAHGLPFISCARSRRSIPTMALSITEGWLSSTCSTSTEAMFSPGDDDVLAVETELDVPSECITARPPVRKQPLQVISRVAWSSR